MSRRCNGGRRRHENREGEVQFELDIDPDPRDYLPDEAFITIEDNRCGRCCINIIYFLMQIFVVVALIAQIYILYDDKNRQVVGNWVGINSGETASNPSQDLNNESRTNKGQVLPESINNNNTKNSFSSCKNKSCKAKCKNCGNKKLKTKNAQISKETNNNYRKKSSNYAEATHIKSNTNQQTNSDEVAIRNDGQTRKKETCGKDCKAPCAPKENQMDTRKELNVKKDCDIKDEKKVYFSDSFDDCPENECDFGPEEINKSSFNSDDIIEINRQLIDLKLELHALRETLENTTIWKNNLEEKLTTCNTCRALVNNKGNTTEIGELIEDAIDKYDADKNGKTDYALETAGGSICSTPGTVPFPSKTTYQVFGLVTLHYPSNPRLMIQPGTRPGECFAFHGNNGRIRIKLAQRVNVTEVGLEHTTLAYDNTTTPKCFNVYGADNEEDEADYKLGHFKYIQGEKSLQSFPINPERSVKCFDFIELHILSNYGHPHYTCIYRFRVHGDPCTEELEDDSSTHKV